MAGPVFTCSTPPSSESLASFTVLPACASRASTAPFQPVAEIPPPATGCAVSSCALRGNAALRKAATVKHRKAERMGRIPLGREIGKQLDYMPARPELLYLSRRPQTRRFRVV